MNDELDEVLWSGSKSVGHDAEGRRVELRAVTYALFDPSFDNEWVDRVCAIQRRIVAEFLVRSVYARDEAGAWHLVERARELINSYVECTKVCMREGDLVVEKMWSEPSPLAPGTRQRSTADDSIWRPALSP